MRYVKRSGWRLAAMAALVVAACESAPERVPPAGTPASRPAPTAAAPSGGEAALAVEEVVYSRGEYTLKGHLCRPAGPGPFPAVVYNHGGVGAGIGGDPVATVRALAADGYVGFAPLRRPTRSLAGHLDDVTAGLRYLRGRGEVDSARIGLAGFSRGGLLTVMAAIAEPDLRAVVVMAPAPGGRDDLERCLAQAGGITAPVLILVAANDTRQADHVALSRRLNEALVGAGRTSRLIVYPPFGTDGHRLFFTVGEYWAEIRAFLATALPAGAPGRS